jgi:hypothetical protein
LWHVIKTARKDFPHKRVLLSFCRDACPSKNQNTVFAQFFFFFL